MNKILIIEDDEMLAKNLKLFLEKEHFSVDTTLSGEQGLEFYRKTSYQIVLLDYNLPGMDGLEVLSGLKGMDEEAYVIMMTGHGDIETAVEAMKVGASDFLPKPISSPIILNLIQDALKNLADRSELQLLKRDRQRKQQTSTLLGNSLPLQRLQNLIRLISESNPGSVLVTGENGTGKELIAKSLHKLSNRSEKPFIDINCASIPDDLFENELFGHEKGAFTDAQGTKKGFFELAHGGTIFLDEVGELPLKMQSKLLRVLEDRSFYRIGGQKKIDLDIHFIFATNRDLKAMIERGEFREDLFYRLNIIEVYAPALRDHLDDLPVLIDHFQRTFNHQYARSIKGLTPEAMHMLQTYNFPGNVRELRNLIERAVILCQTDRITVEDLQMFNGSQPAVAPTMVIKPFTIAKSESHAQFERDYVIKLLSKTRGNVSEAADLAGLKTPNLSRLLGKYNIDKKAYK